MKEGGGGHHSMKEGGGEHHSMKEGGGGHHNSMKEGGGEHHSMKEGGGGHHSMKEGGGGHHSMKEYGQHTLTHNQVFVGGACQAEVHMDQEDVRGQTWHQEGSYTITQFEGGEAYYI